MQKNVLKIFSCFLVMVVLSLSASPVQAVDTEYVSKESFWNWVASSGDIAQGILSHINIAGSVHDVCSKSEDGYHHSNGGVEKKDGYFDCLCRDCGVHFKGYVSDLSAAYNDYVESLPAPGYTSTGYLTWQPTIDDISILYPDDSKNRAFFEYHSISGSSYSLDVKNYSSGAFTSVGPSATKTGLVFISSGGLSGFNVGLYRFYFNVPFSGSYRYDKAICSYSILLVSGSQLTDTKAITSNIFLHSDTSGRLAFNVRFGDLASGAAVSYGRATLSFPVFEVIPDAALSGDTYNINTRPASITGGNYGIVGDNGQITKVEDNSTIINETNNTFYNPATGTTVPIVNWSYDYSDRSYKVTLESGDTATITYGDENITIQETTVTEGDTITNNYTIYYLVDGSGSVTPPCEHDWQETNRTDPTCTRPGSASYFCPKCQQPKTEPLPALGHTWQVKQTVTTQYDDTGQLIQEGYTIFECSRCHEQYKSADGTIPPGGSGTDPGGDEGETIWDKLGKLLGAAVKGILDLLGSAVDVILGGLIDLVTNLFESLKQLVDLFGSVGEAFGVLWTWLPPEIMAILVAGVSIFVFVALLKLFMK